jgi:hypothetical protein
MLDPDKIMQSNFFLRMNQLQVQTNRWMIGGNGENHTYADYETGSSWQSQASVWNVSSSRDGGLSFIWEDQSTLYSAHFYLSNKATIHQYVLYRWWSILGNIGGNYYIFLTLFMFVCSKFNKQMLMAKAIRNLYFELERYGFTSKPHDENQLKV